MGLQLKIPMKLHQITIFTVVMKSLSRELHGLINVNFRS